MKNKILIIIFSIFLIQCKSKPHEEENADVVISENLVRLTDMQLKNTEIISGKIEQKPMSSLLVLNGKIDVPPQNMVSVSMPLGGYLKSTKLLAGMHVSRGEVIATMEDQQYIQLQQDYLTTKARLTYAEAEFQRQKELNKSKASSDKMFQEAEMDYRTLKIELSGLVEKLKLINVNPLQLSENTLSKNINVYSPINGFVSKVNVNIGKYLNPADVMFELVNPEDIHLNLKVFEKDIKKLVIGQKLVAFTNNSPEKKHPCEIILISKDLSSEGIAEVHCHFEDFDKSLLPGMYMNAEVEIATNNSYTIENDGLVRYEGKDYVFEAKSKNEFLLREVILGNAENGFTQISFADNSEMGNVNFVTKGAYTLLMKMKNTEEE